MTVSRELQKRHERFPLIDALRGFALVNMIAYHFLYDVNIVYGLDPNWYAKRSVYIWQQFICWTFLLVLGFVWRGNTIKNFRRGIFYNALGLLLTAVTALAIPSEIILFGILNCAGCVILLLIPFSRALDRVPAPLGIVISAALFGLTKHIQSGWIGISGVIQLTCPAWLYRVRIFTPLGFPFPGFRSSDYFPLLPWTFLCVCGYYARTLFDNSRDEKLKALARREIPVLSKIGKRTIWAYLLHQPVCMLVCIVLFRRLP